MPLKPHQQLLVVHGMLITLALITIWTSAFGGDWLEVTFVVGNRTFTRIYGLVPYDGSLGAPMAAASNLVYLALGASILLVGGFIVTAIKTWKNDFTYSSRHLFYFMSSMCTFIVVMEFVAFMLLITFSPNYYERTHGVKSQTIGWSAYIGLLSCFIAGIPVEPLILIARSISEED